MQVVAAGSPQQIADAMRDAEQYREALLERAVLIIPLPIYGGEPAAQEDGASNSSSTAEQAKEDLRYANVISHGSRKQILLECNSLHVLVCLLGLLSRRNQEQLRWR